MAGKGDFAIVPSTTAGWKILQRCSSTKHRRTEQLGWTARQRSIDTCWQATILHSKHRCLRRGFPIHTIKIDWLIIYGLIDWSIKTHWFRIIFHQATSTEDVQISIQQLEQGILTLEPEQRKSIQKVGSARLFYRHDMWRSCVDCLPCFRNLWLAFPLSMLIESRTACNVSFS